MHHWISEEYYALFNGFPEHLNRDCLPPSFKLGRADGELLLEPLLFIQGDAINLSPKLVSDLLRISQAPARGFCLSIRSGYLNLRSLVRRHFCHHVSIVFGSSFHYGKFFCEFASGTGCTSSDFLQ